MFFLKLISFKKFICGSNLMIEVFGPNQFPKMIVNCHAMSRLIYNDITFELWKLMFFTANAKNIISNFFFLWNILCKHYVDLVRDLLCMSVRIFYRSDRKCKIESLHGLRRGLKCSQAQSHHFSSRVNERIFFASITLF